MILDQTANSDTCREGCGHCVCVILDEEAEKERALTSLCIAKCGGMDLANHKTAYNALKNIKQPHKDNLKRCGYCESQHNFHSNFSKGNGAKGAVPVTPKEWFPEHRKHSALAEIRWNLQGFTCVQAH